RQLDGGGVVGDGGVELAGRLPGEPPVEHGGQIALIEGEGVVEVGDRLVEVAAFAMDAAAVGVGGGELRVHEEGAAVDGDGGIEFVAVGMRVALGYEGFGLGVGDRGPQGDDDGRDAHGRKFHTALGY